MASELNVGKVTASAVTIYNDGANSFVNNATGQLFINKAGPSNCWIHGPEVGLASADGTETLFRATQNGSVKLYYDNAIKLETSATGLAVTGAVSATGNTTVGSAVAATNVELNLNGVSLKATRIQFQEGGVNKWLLGQGAASETEAFELFNAAGVIVLQVDRTSNLATFSNGIAVTTGGIQFPATQSASADANNLDDYEQGVFTPVLGGGACTNVVGKYTKVGNQVTVTIEVANGVLSGASGYSITGLPFSNGSTRSGTGAVAFTQLIDNANPVGIVVGSTHQIDFIYNNASSSWSVVNLVNTTGWLHFSATYFV